MYIISRHGTFVKLDFMFLKQNKMNELIQNIYIKRPQILFKILTATGRYVRICLTAIRIISIRDRFKNLKLYFSVFVDKFKNQTTLMN